MMLSLPILVTFLALVCEGREIITKKYRSPHVSLRSGQIANTPNDFGPLEFPPGPVAIHYFKGDVVDEKGVSVPLNEVYVHHWLVFAYSAEGVPLHNRGVCTPLLNPYGIGAELRGTAYQYPEPYALVTTGKEIWGVNLHLIRTTNVPQDKVQDCIECRCPDSNPPTQPDGGVGCCPDGGQCYGMSNSKLNDTKKYYLEYEIQYSEVASDIKPITVFSFDVTSRDTYDCGIEYNIPGPLATGQISTLESVSESPSDIDVVFMQPHQHIGGVNFTIEHIASGTKCSITPVYGTGDTAGNEKDYLVKIPFCEYPASAPLKIKKGDKIKLTSVYDGRTLPGGHSWHGGVMGLIYVHGEAPKTDLQSCLTELHKLCGSPPYSTFKDCQDCAFSENHLKQLLNSGCDDDMVIAECGKTGGSGDVPVPAGLSGMSFNLVETPKDSFKVRLIGPVKTWFAVAFNGDEAQMDGSTAWIYTKVDDKTVLEQRSLGNHQLGPIQSTSYPHTVISQTEDSITLEFEITQWKAGTKNCWLFAQGDVLEGSVLQYHGSRRGATCGYPNPSLSDIIIL